MSTLQIPDPSLILLIGPSGAGKSTFAARHFLPTEVISSDRCRAMLTDDESDQTINHEAFALLHQIARARLAAGKLAVIDATNLQFRARRPLLRMARQHRMPVVAIVFKPSIHNCLAQNRARPDRVVAEAVIENHMRELADALRRIEREGYGKIYRLDETMVADVMIERIGAGLAGG